MLDDNQIQDILNNVKNTVGFNESDDKGAFLAGAAVALYTAKPILEKQYGAAEDMNLINVTDLRNLRKKVDNFKEAFRELGEA